MSGTITQVFMDWWSCCGPFIADSPWWFSYKQCLYWRRQNV